MVNLKKGDLVDCLIKVNVIINGYETDYDSVKTFEIIGHDYTGYYLYIPHYLLIKGTIKLDNYNCKDLDIDKKYIGENSIYIKESFVHKVNKILDGCKCIKCGQFYFGQDPNVYNSSYICYKCIWDPFE